ncbi:MAG: type transport system ATP-binding protein [Solirubrobacteraceae bacterium]|nr:type transport system ATP-binding protein [Solirubrobacteraceae bacterium]
MPRKLLVCLSVLGSLVVCSSAQAAITSVFTNTATPVACYDAPGGATAGQRWCSGTAATPNSALGAASTVPSFDGTPIDVSVTLPPPASPDSGYPVVGVFHGYGQSKRLGSDANNVQRWVARGYAVFSMTTRGLGNSCGAGVPNPKPPECAKGYIHLLSNQWEVRDAQYLLGKLADEGVIDNARVGVTGISYGGGTSLQMAALNDRMVLGALTGETNGDVVPWKSTGNLPMSIKGAVPEFGWSDFAYSLVQPGSTLDYAARNPYRGPSGDRRIGIEKQGWISYFYGIGLVTGYFEATGTGDPRYDVTAIKSTFDTGGPYDGNTVAENAVNELTAYHSAYYIDDATTAPAPTLLAQGWNDDLFPVDEAVRYYNKVREDHPDTPINLWAFDYGHSPRAQINNFNVAGLFGAEGEWMDYYVRGLGVAPVDAKGGVNVIPSGCTDDTSGSTSAADAAVHAASWALLAPGELTLDTPTAKTIAASTTPSNPFQAFAPSPTPTICTTTSSTDTPGAADYTLAAQSADYTLAGSPTVKADVTTGSASDQLAARLYDVNVGAGTERLIARQALRPYGTNPGTNTLVFQLHPQQWRVVAGHELKLELLSTDQPYTNATPGQTQMSVSNLTLRIPTLDAPGAAAGAVKAPAAKVLPPGYTLARDFVTPTPTPSVTPVPTYVVPTPTPTYTIKKRPGLTGKVTPKRDRKKPFRFKVAGKLKRPSGVTKSAGCKGKVRITVKKGKKTLARKTVSVKSSCTYSARVKLNKKAGKKGKAKFSISFRGNSKLLKKTIKRSARYGRK